MLDDIINKLYAYFLKWPLNNGVTNISSVKLVSLNPKTSKKLKAYRTTSKAKKKKKKKKDRLWLQYLPLLHPLHYEKSSLSDCFNRISTLNKMLRLALVTKLFWLSF